MNTEPQASKAVDRIQHTLVQYASNITYDSLSPEAIQTVKSRFVDTLGVLLAGFFGEPCLIARNLAAQMPNPAGATVLGTRMKTTLDMAAFVNATTARHLEMNDCYHHPGTTGGGHPSDTLTPVLAAAEHARAGGRELITGIVLAYEVYLRFNDAFHNTGFDHTNFACLGTAVAAGKLLNLSADQLAHCISMAIVPNNTLRQVRESEHLSMFKAAASGQAGRAGVFAALLARAGMEGPHLPFEGKAAWLDHIARQRFSLDVMGGNGIPFKILESLIKNRQAAAIIIAPILAAEKLAPVKSVEEVLRITVEVIKRAKDHMGTGPHRWNLDAKESADHSIPYVTAAALLDGTISNRSYDDAHLNNRELRALMNKIEVLENAEYTRAFSRHPQEHRARVTILYKNGEQLQAETGGDPDDIATPKSDEQIEQKFRMLTEDILGTKRAKRILSLLWDLESLADISEVPRACVIS